jgi:hypothetical protein
MKLRTADAILREIGLCADSGDGTRLSSLFMELEIASLDCSSDALFRKLIELQRSEPFRHLSDSWKILYFTNNNWELFSDEQRAEIHRILKDAFDKYADWMAAFVSSEILGDRYPDKSSLVTLSELGETASLPARAAVPHGLETLARCTSDESVRRLSIKQLRRLQKSEFAQVREEASKSLAKFDH